MRLRRGQALAVLAPVMLLMLVLYVYPVLRIFALSVIDDDGRFSAESYVNFAQTEVYLRILWRTIYTAGIVTVLSLVVAYPYALLMTRVGTRMRALMLAFVLVPLWTSLLARTYAWIILLSDVGPIRALLAVAGLEVRLLGEFPGVVIGMVQVLLPFMTLPLYNNMRDVDARLIAAATSLGATPIKAFWQVYFPLTRPGIATGSVMVFVLGLGFYVTPALLGSPAQSMLAQLIAQEVSLKLAWGSAGAMSVILSLLTLGMLLLAARFGGKSLLKGGLGA